MNTIESLRAITRRAIPLNYHSPGVCHLPIPPGSGTGSSTPSELEFLPVRQKAGPASLSAQVIGSDVSLTWSDVSYAHSYVIYRSNNVGGPYSLVAANVFPTNYLDVGVPAGTWFYKTTALEEDFGETTASPVVEVMV